MQQGLPVRSATDRRQPLRSDQRRSAILDALDHHLKEQGFEAVNIADVTAGAGVTRSAFYFYFENKGAAVAALLEPLYDDVFVATDILTSTAEPPQWRVRTMIETLVQTAELHRYLFRAMLEARAVNSAVRELWDRARESFVPHVAVMIANERAAGRAPEGPDPELLAVMLLEFNDRLLERLTLGGTLRREQLIDGAEAIWMRTIYGAIADIDTRPTS